MIEISNDLNFDLTDYCDLSSYAKELTALNGFFIHKQRVSNWLFRGQVEYINHASYGKLVKRGTLTVRKYKNIEIKQ